MISTIRNHRLFAVFAALALVLVLALGLFASAALTEGKGGHKVFVKKKVATAAAVQYKKTATPAAVQYKKTATATPTAKTVTATATAKTVTAKAAKAQYAQYKQYASVTALPPTGGSGPVLPIAVGALLLIMGSGIMVLKMARSSS